MPSQRTRAEEQAIRHDVFVWLDAQADTGKYEFRRADLENYHFNGERITLLDRNRGIRNPASFSATLSVMTSATSHPYADEALEGGIFRYSYRAQEGGDNKKLVAAYEQQAPIVYFRGVRPGFYVAVYPVYVIRNLPHQQAVMLGVDEVSRLIDNLDTPSPDLRRYAERVARVRLHQPMFRAKVMHAYDGSCAICTLRHAELLDAAHIIGDQHEGGDAIVSNGVALCKIHHAAYDRNLLGITPEYRVQINGALLDEVDGPMLRHGLQDMHGQTLHVPRRKVERPDSERLEQRFAEFLAQQSMTAATPPSHSTIAAPDIQALDLPVPTGVNENPSELANLARSTADA